MGFLMSKFVLFYNLKQVLIIFLILDLNMENRILFLNCKSGLFSLLTKHDVSAVAPYFYVALGEISHKYDKTCD